MSLTSESKCHILFLGETAAGKSSVINLLLETSTSIQAADIRRPHSQVGTSYEIVLNGVKYTLWDTRGLREASSGLLRNIFEFESIPEKELKKFLKERHQRHEFDLLVYCVRGSRAPDALAKYYHRFCSITRQLVAPVAIVVTHLENEPDMENWWHKNSPRLEQLKMAFDGHACITTISGHAQTAVSKERLVDLVTKKNPWKVQRTGSYFGSQVQTAITSSVSRNKFMPAFVKVKSMSLDYWRAVFPGRSVPSRPVVEPPSPRNATGESERAKSDTDLLRVNAPSIEETSRARYSLYSLSPRSTSTLYAGVNLQPCIEESEDYLLNKPPLKHSTATVVRKNGYATLHGPFGDIWECDLIEGESSCIVAVKAVKLRRNGHNDLGSHEKKLRRELGIWGRLQHQNIVPLLGIVPDFGPLPSMVSPWFSNGSLTRYLENRLIPTSEKRQLVRDIAAGLSYIHSQKIIHGDLHGDNVLIDDAGRACLTDFALSFNPEFMGTSYLKSSIGGGVQFADPALVQRAHNSRDVFYPTEPCDVYSFGGLMLHALSQKKPYDGLTTGDILRKVLAGERPEIPTHDSITLSDGSLIRKCWDHEEHNRPLADSLVAMFDQQ